MSGMPLIVRNLWKRTRRRIAGAYNTWLLRARREVTPALWEGEQSTIQNDRDTVRPDMPVAASIYHYATLESSVARILADRGKDTVTRAVDIGSGSGHWVAFMLREFPAIQSVACQELSPGRCAFLRQRFAAEPRVTVAEGRAEDVRIGHEVDLVNLIGVGFHIVDDAALARLLKTIAEHLSSDGIVLVNDLLPMMSQGVQFARHPVQVICIKYLRSRRCWRALAAAAGLRCSFYTNFAWVRAPEPIPEGHFVCLHR